MKYLLIALLLMTTTANAENYFTAVVGGVSTHVGHEGFEDFDGEWKRFNSKHNLFGVEYRNAEYGFGVSTFKNSYFDRSYLVTASNYYKYDYFEVIASVGAVTGYENRDGCMLPMGSLCGVLSLGIELDTPYIKPRVTLYGNAIVLSATIRF